MRAPLVLRRKATVAHIRLREKHNRKCGGDPNIAPQLSFEIDLKTGAATWA